MKALALTSTPLDALRAAVGAGQVLQSPEALRLYSQDVYRAGVLPLAVVQPAAVAEVQAVVQIAREHGLALFARGGGMSYTDAYLPDRAACLVLDLRRLNRIRAVNVEDLHATVEAGCTWAEVDAALLPHGVRAIFWGPMSGQLATVGGGMSQGAATFGSGRHGTSASAALSFEVVLGDGSVLHTGLDAAPGRAPFFRNYGPDLTGVFSNDAGALGIKTAVSLQLEPRPACHGSVAFGFADFPALRRAVSAVARDGLATEIFGLENALGQMVAGSAAADSDLRVAWQVARSQGSMPRAARQLLRMALAGRRFLSGASYTANFIAEGRDAASLQRTLDAIRRHAEAHGTETANTMGAVVRAMPFPAPMVLGPGGRRLLPLHVILPHSKVDAFHAAFEALRTAEGSHLKQHRAVMFVVFAGVGPSALLYEPVIYWEDDWSELQRATMPPHMLAQLREGAPNPDARAYVETLRQRVIALMLEHGGAHLQVGRAYPYLAGRSAASIDLLAAIKRQTDPENLINPGALGLAP